MSKEKKLLHRFISLALVMALMLVAMAGCASKPASDNSQPSSGNSQGSQSAAETPAQEDDLEAALAEMKPMTMQFALSLGAGQPSVALLEEFADRIHERTNGVITINVYPSGVIVPPTNVYDSMLDGVVEMGCTDPSYYMSEFPLVNAYSLPGMNYKNSRAATYAANEWIKSDFAELKKAKFLFAFGMCPSTFMTNVKFETLDDFKGTQIRGSGYALEIVERFGAAPVGMPPSETYEAILKNTVDGALSATDFLKNFNLGEVVDYCCGVTGLGTSTYFAAMNLDVWNSLPAPVQKVFEEESAVTLEQFAPLWDGMAQESIEFGISQGMEYYELPQEELEKWWAQANPIVDEWLQEREQEGLDGQAALDRLRSLIEEGNKLYAD